MARLLLLAVAAAILLCVLATPVKPKFRRHHRMIRGRPYRGLVPKEMPGDYEVAAAATQGWFTQNLDHMNGNDTRTWRQRYWYNKQWYKPGGPAFLMLGGEGEESPYWLESDQVEFGKLAVSHGAAVFLLEHRFYGECHPLPDMSVSSLQYLSSVQAIEDIATFIQGMKQQYPDISNGKWVTFGGSYSGALSAWAREKHPELVAAAVGSSGPVQAELDFTEYLEVVQNAINRSSPVCAASVANGMAQVAKLAQTASGQQSLNNIFSICNGGFDWSNPLNVKYFWESVFGVYMEIVQYSGDNVSIFKSQLTTDNAICRFHNNNNTNVLTKMKQVNDFFAQLNDEECTYIDYNGFIEFMKDETYEDAQADRAWVWQTCTEFGYYQSTDSNSAGPFFGGKDKLPVDYYTKECTDIYGSQYTAQFVGQAVQNTNQYYGGRDNLQGTNIALPNGNVDPWHALGKLTSNSTSIVPLVIDGTAHCADMYPSSATDKSSLTITRNKLALQLATWLN